MQAAQDSPESSIPIYRYLSAEYALKSIEERRLRVGRLKELNDPLEWHFHISGSHPGVLDAAKRAFTDFVERMHHQFGILCFSETVSDPVLWSHYAEGHKGVVLQMEHPTDTGIKQVRYEPMPPLFDLDEFLLHSTDPQYTNATLVEALGRKAPSWHYEKEWRAHISLDDCDTSHGHFFHPMPDELLKRVILGMRCNLDEEYLKRALVKAGFKNVPVVRARKSDSTYEVLCD